MDLKDQFKYLVGGYYGITYIDEYPLKVYILKDIEDYIRDFVLTNPIDNFNYQEEAKNIDEQLSIKTKLQDSLLVLPRVKAPLELVLMVKEKIKNMNEKKDI